MSNKTTVLGRVRDAIDNYVLDNFHEPDTLVLGQDEYEWVQRFFDFSTAPGPASHLYGLEILMAPGSRVEVFAKFPFRERAT